MKFIIAGLGIFGASLAEKLTQQGNEVIGVDSKMEKVNLLKDKISHTICMDATNQDAIANLPLKNTDVVIVCIGEDQGTNIMVTALFKNLGVKRLISRSINPLHENVLQAIGITEIVRPEEETAERWAKKLCLKGIVDSFELDKDYSIIEVNIPEQCLNKTIEEVKFKEIYNLLVLTIVNQVEENSFFGNTKMVSKINGIPDAKTVLKEGDILVLFGAKKDLENFLQEE